VGGVGGSVAGGSVGGCDGQVVLTCRPRADAHGNRRGG